MIIKYADDSDKHSWNDYIKNSKFGTFYHLYEWKTIFEKAFNHKCFYLMGMNNDVVVGVLPLVQLKSILFGNIICSLPFLNYGGVVCSDLSYETNFMEEMLHISEKCNPSYIELRQKYKTSLNLPYKDHKVSMTIDLDPNPENLWNKYNSKLRTSIRKAKKNGLVVEKGSIEYLDDFYRLISIGWKHMGTPIYNKKFFTTILEELAEFVEIFILKHQNRVVGVAFNGKYKSTIEGMWTFVLPEIKRLNGNYLLYWEMIRHACLEGYEIFHLGRSSKDSGGEFFKKKWNAYSHQLYWEYILPGGEQIPDVSVTNSKYGLYIKLWRKLPLKITQSIGPIIAKYIP